MQDTLMPTIPYVEAKHQGKKQRKKSILIRLSETTSAPGAALGLANEWHKFGSKEESCHYIVDQENIIQCVPDNLTAFPTPLSSKNTISINVCAQPTIYPETWFGFDYGRVLDRTAELVAVLCSKHHIPVRDSDLIQHQTWLARGGIILAVKGNWPTEAFLEQVQSLKKLP